jgi:2-polyprenyl-3-methyl-5-hydroxy-6-metoxy-1,4-benzoquinol methylase
MPGPCPICHDTHARLRYRLTRFSIFDCTACGQTFLHPLPSPEEIERLFQSLYTSGECDLPELKGYYDYCYDDSPTNPLVQSYERWLAALERHRAPGTMLDVGCGTGLFLATARRRGWRVTGIDANAEATAWAREHFGLEVRTGEFSAFETNGRGFDAITMWDIIEHSREPLGLLTAARRALAPGGMLALSTPNQRSMLDVVAGALYHLTAGRVTAPLEKFYIDQHFIYFSPATLAAALRRAGLAVTELVGEATDLRRLTLSAPKRLVLQTLFAVGRATGLDNRLFAVARAGA